jgi:hypothetical protein
MAWQTVRTFEGLKTDANGGSFFSEDLKGMLCGAVLWSARKEEVNVT